MFSLNFMFFCSLIEELCTKEENYKTSCKFNFRHECICANKKTHFYFKYLQLYFSILVKVISHVGKSSETWGKKVLDGSFQIIKNHRRFFGSKRVSIEETSGSQFLRNAAMRWTAHGAWKSHAIKLVLHLFFSRY